MPFDSRGLYCKDVYCFIYTFINFKVITNSPIKTIVLIRVGERVDNTFIVIVLKLTFPYLKLFPICKHHK